MRTLILSIWILFLLGIPFYVFADGLPQPAYFLVPLIAVMVLLEHLRQGLLRLDAGHGKIMLVLVFFVMYTVVVPFFWYLWLGNPKMLFYPAFYVFDLILFWVVLSLHTEHGARFDALTEKSIVVAIVLQVALLFAVGTNNELRQSLFFNNPNQLGYYALLTNTALSSSMSARAFRRDGW